jgi:hypothetical protein
MLIHTCENAHCAVDKCLLPYRLTQANRQRLPYHLHLYILAEGMPSRYVQQAVGCKRQKSTAACPVPYRYKYSHNFLKSITENLIGSSDPIGSRTYTKQNCNLGAHKNGHFTVLFKCLLI